MTDPRSQPDSPTPARVAGAAARLRADLPLLFLAYALPAVIFLAVAMPPFQVADELAHTLRADQISLGQIVSPRLGGDVHGDLVVFGAMYQPLWFHSEVKQTVELARRAGALAWSPWIKDENFQNTAQYGPFLYAPQVAGLWLGEAIGLSCAQTLVLARLVNGLTASVLAFLALRRCRRGRALLFATLLLPMTLSELGSASQDALIIGLSILAAAIASRVLSEERSARVGEFALFAFTVVATTLARPSQLALVLLAPAFVARHDPRWRAKLAIAAPAVFAVVGWLAF